MGPLEPNIDGPCESRLSNIDEPFETIMPNMDPCWVPNMDSDWLDLILARSQKNFNWIWKTATRWLDSPQRIANTHKIYDDAAWIHRDWFKCKISIDWNHEEMDYMKHVKDGRGKITALGSADISHLVDLVKCYAAAFDLKKNT